MWMDHKILSPHDSPYSQVWYGVWRVMIANKVTLVILDDFQTWFWTLTDLQEIWHLSRHCRQTENRFATLETACSTFPCKKYCLKSSEIVMIKWRQQQWFMLAIIIPGNLLVFKIKSKCNQYNLGHFVGNHDSSYTISNLRVWAIMRSKDFMIHPHLAEKWVLYLCNELLDTLY